MRPLLKVCAIALSALSTRAGVTVVAPSGGDFTSIAAAVNAAPAGEIVLVKSGSYASFTISGKGVHVIADAGATVNVTGPVVVEAVPASQSATLQGLEILQTSIPQNPALRVQNCVGTVRVVDSTTFAGFPPLGFPSNPPSVVIDGSQDVACANDDFRGMRGAASQLTGSAPSPAMSVTSSTLSLHDCVLVGGTGAPGLTGLPAGNSAGGPGAPGLVCAASSLFLSGGSASGGTGGHGVSGTSCSAPYTHPTRGGTGGPGLSTDGASVVRELEPVIVGGSGGASGTAPDCTPPPGDPGVESIGGSPAQLAGSARHLAVVAPARAGANVTLHFEGQPGDAVFLALALRGTQFFEPVLNGTLLVLPAFRRLRVGTLDGNGNLDVLLPVGAFPPGVEGSLHHAQGIFRDVAGTLWTSGPGAMTRLDASF